MGRTWKEAEKPPAFRKAKKGEPSWVVDHVFWLTPGHESEPGVWYAGTSPQGLFRSEDGGATWKPVDGFNDNPDRKNDRIDARMLRRQAMRRQVPGETPVEPNPKTMIPSTFSPEAIAKSMTETLGRTAA